MTVRPFCADWVGYKRRTIEVIRRLSVADLALPVRAVSLTLGANGRAPINPWPGSDWESEAPPSLREG